MKTIKIAIIGCGRISGHHCRAIRNIKGLEIAAVCDLAEEKSLIYSKEFNVPSFTNYRKMFEQVPDIDTVVIASPSGMHFEHSMEVMSVFKKNIIVEKPTFMKPSEVKLAYECARENDLHIFPIFQNRFNKAVQKVKQALNDGLLGDIHLLSVRVRWCRPQRYYDLSEWRGTYAMDGGALTNQGIHHVDLIRYLGGELTSVNSIMRTLGAEIEVEDTVVSNLEFTSNAIGTLEVTTAARPDDFEASISIVGSKGLAKIGGKAVNELEIFTPSPEDCPKYSEDFTGSVYGNGHEFLYKSIADFFHKDIPYIISEDDCSKSIHLLHSFYVSSERKSPVNPTDQLESKRLGQKDEKLADLYRV